MPNWDSVLKEIWTVQVTENESAHDKVRRKYLGLLFKHTKRNIIAYYSGFLSKPGQAGTEITDEDKNGFMLCIHEMDRNKGLDLILHTPGGDGEATASLVEYLREIFGRNMRAIVPQIAMSAGTMIAFSCKSIVMGKESSLGPVDPQFGVISAANLLEEVQKARREIMSNPAMAAFWSPILNKITPSFLERCEVAVRRQDEFIGATLRQNMFLMAEAVGLDEKVARVRALFGNTEGRAHNTHIHYNQCEDAGLSVQRLEDDQKLQDLVLTIHHCYMHSLSNTPAFKIIENHFGRSTVKIQQQQIPLISGQMSLGGVA